MKKNFFYNFLLTGGNVIFPLLTFPYLSRVLGADGLGICNFVHSYTQSFIIIAALGLPVYGMREIAKVSKDKVRCSKLFYELLTIHFTSTLLFLSLYIFSVFLSSDLSKHRELALAGGALIFLNVFSIEWLFSGLNDFKYVAIRSLIFKGLSVVLIFVFVETSEDYFLYFLILISTVLCNCIMDIFYCRRLVAHKFSISLGGIKEHLKPICLLGVYMVFTSIYSILPTTLLGFISTNAAVGYYYAANRIIRLVIAVFSALIFVMIPKLNLAVASNATEQYKSDINKSLNIVIAFGIPLSIYFFLLAGPVVRLLAGDEFENSIFLVQIMSPIIVIVAFAQVFVLLILSVNRKDKQMILLSVVGMCVSVIINLALIPSMAEKATGLSQLIAELAVTSLAFFFSRKVLKFQIPVQKIFLNIMLALPFVLVVYAVQYIVKNNILVIVFSTMVCWAYFLFYQVTILKDQFIRGLINQYLPKWKPLDNAFRIF